MRGWRGFLTAALGLVFLETIVQPKSSSRVSGGIKDLTSLAKKFLDPSVAAIKAAPKSSSDGGPSGLLGDILGLVPSGPITGIPLSPVSIQTPTNPTTGGAAGTLDPRGITV